MRLLLFVALLGSMSMALAEVDSTPDVGSAKWDQLDSLLKKADKIVQDLEEEEDMDEEEVPDNALPDYHTEGRKNPCEDHLCPWGRECVITKKGAAHCDCIKRCPQADSDPDEKVCTNQNETMTSICELYRQRCICRKDRPGCIDNKYKHVHLEYLGKCKQIETCTDELLAQFPERMSDWLFQVMKDLKDRKELHGDEWMDWIEQAELDDHLKHVYPVIWKFCDLDKKPHDKHVVPHELIPITAPVIPMESCIKPFLRSCDTDNNDQISLKEWGKCLGLQEGEIIEKC